MLIRRIFDNPISYRNPFIELERMRREMDMLTGNLFRPELHRAAPSGVFPALNLTEDNDYYYIRAEIPGVKAEDLDVQASGQSISISGEIKIAVEKESANYHRREREAGRFSRIIDLPRAVDTEKVEADLSNGILTIKVLKAEIAKPKKISIK